MECVDGDVQSAEHLECECGERSEVSLECGEDAVEECLLLWGFEEGDPLEDKLLGEGAQSGMGVEVFPVLEEVTAEEILLDRAVRKAEILLPEAYQQRGVAQVPLEDADLITVAVEPEALVIEDKIIKPVVERVDVHFLCVAAVELDGEGFEEDLFVAFADGVFFVVAGEGVVDEGLVEARGVERLVLGFDLPESREEGAELVEHERAGGEGGEVLLFLDVVHELFGVSGAEELDEELTHLIDLKRQDGEGVEVRMASRAPPVSGEEAVLFAEGFEIVVAAGEEDFLRVFVCREIDDTQELEEKLVLGLRDVVDELLIETVEDHNHFSSLVFGDDLLGGDVGMAAEAQCFADDLGDMGEATLHKRLDVPQIDVDDSGFGGIFPVAFVEGAGENAAVEGLAHPVISKQSIDRLGHRIYPVEEIVLDIHFAALDDGGFCDRSFCEDGALEFFLIIFDFFRLTVSGDMVLTRIIFYA